MSDQGVEINRILERCLKESRCVDTESLCIISGDKVILYSQVGSTVCSDITLRT